MKRVLSLFLTACFLFSTAAYADESIDASAYTGESEDAAALAEESEDAAALADESEDAAALADESEDAAVLAKENADAAVYADENEDEATYAGEGIDIAGSNKTVHTIQAKSCPLYVEFSGTEPVYEDFPIYFVDDVNDLPYVDVADVIDFLNDVTEQTSPEDPLYITKYDQDSVTFSLDGSESSLMLDFSENWVIYSSFESFSNGDDRTLMDSLYYSGFNKESGEPELFQRVPGKNLQRRGNPLVISMDNYNIPMIYQDDLYLMPLHTAFDLIIGIPSGGYITCFNGEGIFFGSAGMFGWATPDYVSELGKLYYGAPAVERSEEFAEYGVNELCMELDHFYGLREIHGINSFYELLLGSGLMDSLLSTDANKADLALAALLNNYLDDGHTGYNNNSWMTGLSPEENPMLADPGFSSLQSEEIETLYRDIEENYEDAEKPYLEVGNTAYVHFREFAVEMDPADYYEGVSEDDIDDDTIALIIYAHQQINRKDSPIENVVLDLSDNGGGQVDAAIFVMSWFLGETPFSVAGMATGAMSTAYYRADVNLDRVFDEKDTLEGKNLYCLISPISFSCGNLVPWALKASNRVTLLGGTTGGGSCVVLFMSSAWGSTFQISGTKRISFVKNGSYYDVDRGVDPDVALTKPATFYDREKLTEIINGLY